MTPQAIRAAAIVKAQPGLARRHIGEIMGVSTNVVRRFLREAEAAGLIRYECTGRHARWVPVPEEEQAFARPFQIGRVASVWDLARCV